MITTATQVSNVYATANAGNRVLKAQIVARGPIATTTTTNAIKPNNPITLFINNSLLVGALSLAPSTLLQILRTVRLLERTTVQGCEHLLL